MNAAQAVGNVAAEKAMANANPSLYGQTVQTAPNGKPLTSRRMNVLLKKWGYLIVKASPKRRKD